MYNQQENQEDRPRNKYLTGDNRGYTVFRNRPNHQPIRNIFDTQFDI
jgi:hypothetical protein